MKPITRKCLHCKLRFEPYRPNQVVCSGTCAAHYAALKSKVKAKKEKKEAKEKLKTRTDHLKDLEKEINKTIRIIDKGHPCISCRGNKTPQAGHLHSVKAAPQLRFHLENIWIQDTYCNVHKSGNQLKYLEGIAAIYGKEYADYIQYDLIRTVKELKMTESEIIEVVKIVRNKNKELIALDEYYSDKERVSMRKVLNKYFGIY